jgi:Ca2+/Na+ antiporter
MNKDLITDLAWGVGILVVALLASLARKMGYIDGDTVTRVVIGLTGLMIASFGNRMPKTFVPNALARQARRVAAWSLVLSGLVYAGLWAFAPIPVAVVGGCGAVLLGIAVTIGYCIALRAKAKAA